MTIPDNLMQYQPPANLLQDKNILVTGAGDGIGRAAALSFAQHGANVILLGRTERKLEAVYDEITALDLPQPAIIPFDLATTHEANYRQVAQAIANNIDSLHGLLHNAGALGALKPLQQYNSEMFTDVLNINLLSNFLLTKALLPTMEKATNASVIFTSSSVGRKGRAYWGAYSISKFAVEGMMQVWADELQGTSSIRVNSINPGATNTIMRRQAYPAEAQGSNPEPTDIMGAYLYLMGDDSLEINGQQIDARKS